MKNLLIPTDFSPASDKAIEFGIQIAKTAGAKITLVNTFFIPVLDINVPPTMVQTLYETEKEKSDNKLKELKLKIKTQTDFLNKPLECETICVQSTPQIEISTIVDKKNIDLVIMGTKGKEAFLGLWKSITTDTAKAIHQPLLIVKEDTVYQDFDKIDFAIENVREELHAIKELSEFAKPFHSEITIVHVTKKPKKEDSKEMDNVIELTEENENFLNSIKAFSEYKSIQYKTVLNNDTAEGLIDYINTSDSKLLGVIRYERNWLENIFHKSVIKNLIAESPKALLVIPRR